MEFFYEKFFFGFIKEDEIKLEDCILDVLGNEYVREFLVYVLIKGFWMLLGKEVKVM